MAAVLSMVETEISAKQKAEEQIECAGIMPSRIFGEESGAMLIVPDHEESPGTCYLPLLNVGCQESGSTDNCQQCLYLAPAGRFIGMTLPIQYIIGPAIHQPG